jgi:putative transposase
MGRVRFSRRRSMATLLARHTDEVSDDGRRRLVRHGHLPEREIMTGIGPVGGSLPAGTRSHVGQGCGRIRFSSASGSKSAGRKAQYAIVKTLVPAYRASIWSFINTTISLIRGLAHGLISPSLRIG